MKVFGEYKPSFLNQEEATKNQKQYKVGRVDLNKKELFKYHSNLPVSKKFEAMTYLSKHDKTMYVNDIVKQLQAYYTIQKAETKHPLNFIRVNKFSVSSDALMNLFSKFQMLTEF